jgi:hypothetical protein
VAVGEPQLDSVLDQTLAAVAESGAEERAQADGILLALFAERREALRLLPAPSFEVAAQLVDLAQRLESGAELRDASARPEPGMDFVP